MRSDGLKDPAGLKGEKEEADFKSRGKTTACGHKADVNVDALPEEMIVPVAGRRLRCSKCGGKRINTRPAWHTASNRYGAARD